MPGEYMVLQCLFWITALGFLSAFDFIARKRLGVSAQGYVNLRLPKFIALIICSITAIVSLFMLKNDLIQENAVSYLSVPYFAAISYFIVTFFREMKNVNTKK